jgi:D-tyrosyl-tRNA(Tyr) deacylase
MRILLQRVSRASVSVSGKAISTIGQGLLLFVGFRVGDDGSIVTELAKKVANLRIFADREGKMNLSVLELGLSCLVVSQFTLYGDTKKGNRPSFIAAERPEAAELLYKNFIDELGSLLGMSKIQTGRFGAMMEVESINDGPVTLILEKCID